MKQLFALFAAALLAAPAVACINDFGLSSSEREFRSTYQGGDKPAETSESTLRYALGGAGWALLLGATAYTLCRPGRSR